MNLKGSRQTPTVHSNEPAPRLCTHSRLISDRVTKNEHKAGKVRCVECGDVIPDPYI